MRLLIFGLWKHREVEGFMFSILEKNRAKGFTTRTGFITLITTSGVSCGAAI